MHVTYILGASWGGIPHYATEIANAMTEYAEVTVLKPKDENTNFLDESIEVREEFLPLSRQNALSFDNAMNFFSYRNSHPIDTDIVHYVHTPPQLMIFRSIMGKKGDPPAVATIHATFDSYVDILREEKFPLDILSVLSEWLQYNAAGFEEYIVHSKENKSDLENRGINSDTISVIPHGAISLFEDASPTRETQRDSGDTILFFGYIKDTKGIDDLIEASIIASSDVDDLNVIIAGEGDLSDHSEPLDRDLFTVYNEFISDEEVAALFNQADAVVLPYKQHSGQSGVLSVAFSFGMPVIATSVGDFPDLIDDEGIIVPPEDPVSLSKAIVRMLSDPDLQEKAAESAESKANQLSWDNIAQAHLEVYNRHLR